MTLTLVPGPMASKGQAFTFLGPNAGPECDGCPFKRLCFGLEPGTHYEVRAVRSVTHPCGLHDEGRVHVVEVASAPFATSVETRLLRGTAATWTPIPCGMPECGNYALCHPTGIPPGRHEIVGQEGSLDCPAGYELTRVRLKGL